MNTSRTLWLSLLLTLVGCEVQPRDGAVAAHPEARSTQVRQLIDCTDTGDTVPPEVTITSPAAGPVSGQVLIAVQASDDVLVQEVIFFLDGRYIGSDSSAPYELTWSTQEAFNGPVVLTAMAFDADCNEGSSPSVSVLIDNPGQAAFSAALGAPACESVSSVCDTGTLVSGRGPMGPELNHPNTLGGTCVDGALGAYPLDGALEQLKVFTLDGGPFAAGKRVRLKASITEFYHNGMYMLDLYHAPDATAPVWTLVASIYPYQEYEPELGMGTDFILPAGTSLQAVRGAYRYYRYESDPQCVQDANSDYDDYDDLAFAVGTETDEQPPSVAFTAPADGATEDGVVDFFVAATDNFAVTQVEFFVNGTLFATRTSPPFYGSLFSRSYPNGTYTVTARAWDLAGLSATTAPLTVHFDNDFIPPTISLLSPSDGATVEGTVSLQATASDEDNHPGGASGASFYVDGRYLSYSSTFTSTWNTLTVPNGPHVLKVETFDNAQNQASVSVTVLVDNDLVAPTVSITSPASGAIVSGTVEVTASASDNRAVARVDFFAGGQLLSSDTTAPYSASWDTRTLVHGSGHTLMAKAYDARGQSATHSLSLVVHDATAPTVAITSPTEGARIRGLFSFQATASDNRSVSRVEFYDGATLLVSDSYAPYGLSWNTVYVADGARTLTVKAYDAVGNVGTASLTAIVDNSGPVVSFTAPQAQVVVRGNVALQVSATDPASVTKVEFSFNGVVFHTALSAPFTASWDSTALPDGSNWITAKAYDALGNTRVQGHDVVVDNTGPTVTLTSPAAGAVINQQGTTLTASASDTYSVARVEFYAGAVLVGTDTAAPYSATWRPPAKGTYTLTAKAYDTAGNVTTSAGVVVQGK